MLVILALAACCGIPILVGAVIALTGRKKKAPELDEQGAVQLEQDHRERE